MANSTDTDRKVVKAYIPSYQKERWREHADELGMNQSEFLKAMVQAGRRGFDPGATNPDEPGSGDETPGGTGLEDRVLDVLRERHHSWDDLVEHLTEDMENRLETTLQRLQHEGRIQHSGRHGGYIAEDADGN
jgi:hypothetical protein